MPQKQGGASFQLVSRFEDKGSIIDVEHAEELKDISAVERLRLMARDGIKVVKSVSGGFHNFPLFYVT